MANPRKFSEKIALLHQKQAEETAAFEQIMREVSDATSKVSRGLAPVRGPLRAGSLPDVSQVPPETNPEPSRSKPEEAAIAQYGLPGATQPQTQASPTTQPLTRGRPAGVGPMRAARPQDRKIDTSPYGSSAYLSPPPDSNWRRANSDSALHQSSATPRDISPQGGSPHHLHHGSNHHHHQNISHHHHSGQLGNLSGQLGQLQQHSYSHSHHGLNTALHHSPHAHRRDVNIENMMTLLDSNPNRPRSSCEVPRVPGIHIYPSALETSGTQIASGSLPDLTTLHYTTPPMHGNPLDRDTQDHSSSPYSTSPVSASPATLSPTSVPPLRSTHSPHHSPRSTSQTGSPTAPHHHYTNHHTPQNHLSVPNSNRYLHHSKGVALESSWGGYQQQCSPPSLHSSHSNINVPSPTMGVAPAQVGGASNGGYRSPRSPGSSPGGAGGGGDSPHYDAGGGVTSYASQSNAENFYMNQALLQQHFEQISMDWAQLVQSLVESGVTWTAQVQMDSPATSISYINNVNSNQTQYTQAPLPGSEGGGGGGSIGWAGGGGCSGAAACIQAGSCMGGSSCMPGPHPNTPTTIPDIILTDFSSTNASGDLNKDFNSGLGRDIGSQIHFDSSLFPEDEGIRDSLDPIDLDGFQMLTDPEMNVVSDPTTEDAFRLDRL